MAERALSLKIEVDDREATQKLQNVDRAVGKIESTAIATGDALSTYDRQVQAVVKSKQAAITATDTFAQSMNATREAVSLNSVAVQDLFTWVEQGGKGWGDYATMAKEAWTALKGMTFADIRGGIAAIGEAAGLTYANLGLMGSAGAVLGAGYGGWAIGRMVADFFDLDKKIGNATARLLGFGDVAAQEAGAKQDVITLAVKRGAEAMISYADALKFNAQWVENWKAGARELSDIAARQNAPAEFAKQMRDWHAEIKSISDSGGLPALKAGLESHLISVKDLSASYRISEGAVNLFKQQLEKEAAAAKVAAQEHKRRADEAERAAERETAAWEKLQEKVTHLETGYFGVSASIKHLGLIYPPISQDVIKETNEIFDAVHKLEGGAWGATKAMEHLGVQSKPAMSDLAKTMKDTFSGGLKDIVTGGGFGQMGGAISKALDPAAILNSAIGGGLSSLVSMGIQGIGSLFKKLFGDPEKEINPVREAYVQAAGGLAQLNEKAFAATGSLTLVQNLLAAKNADQYKVAIDALNTALDTQKQHLADLNAALGDLLKSAQDAGMKLPASFDPAIQKLVDMGKITSENATLFASLSGSTEVDFKKMQSVAEKYGIKLADLGPSFQSARLHDLAKGIINDFDLLQRGGADVDVVLAGMRKPINDLVNDSLKFGVAIPANMKPWVDQLYLTGQLTDENGVKLDTLSGLKFADPIKTEFQKIVDKLQELIDKIAAPGGVADAINKGIPSTKTVHIGFDIDNPPDWWNQAPAFHAGGVVERMHGGGVVLPFQIRAHRGLAIDEVPIIAQRGEGILNRQAMQRIGGAGALNRMNSGGGGGTSVSVTIDGLVVERGMEEHEAEELIGKAMVRAMRRKGVRIAS